MKKYARMTIERDVEDDDSYTSSWSPELVSGRTGSMEMSRVVVIL